MLFPRIGLMSRHQSNPEALETLIMVYDFLRNQQREVVIDADTSHLLSHKQTWPSIPRDQLGNRCDLIIVVGGDGSLLEAARTVAPFNIPVLGINRGQLGFLTDIHPRETKDRILDILTGYYTEETRFLLSGTIYRHNNTSEPTETALNDITVYAGHLSRLIEFEVFIDQQFVYRQRSDGLIVSTPTGSTAYALSGGGPIIHPSLEAIELVPMMPHTLTSRPIVVHSSSVIDVVIPTHLNNHPDVSFDGQGIKSLHPGDRLSINRNPHTLRLIHPTDYDYYHTLRTKLQWSIKLETKV